MLNINLDLKARLLSKTFWISLISLFVLLSQQIGFDITTVIPKNYAEIVNTIFAILTLVGIVADTSTPGISDKIISNMAVQNINDTKEEVKVEDTTTAVNNTVSENSQSGSADAAVITSDKERETNQGSIDTVAILAENEKLKEQLKVVKSAFAENITNPSDNGVVKA